MRKLLLITGFIFFNVYCFSQIASYNVVSFKDYDNGNRISYVKVFGISDKKQADYIISEILKKPGISRFYIYDKEKNFNLCMVESQSTINDEYVKSLMNEIIIEYNEILDFIKEISEEMPKIIDTGNPEFDKQIFKEKKEEWIKNNPLEYEIVKVSEISSYTKSLIIQLKEQMKK